MILTPEERLRFMEYCKCEAESCRGIADQLQKLGTHAITHNLVGVERAKAKAFSVVALCLASSTEEFTVGKEDIGDLEDGHGSPPAKLGGE